MLHSLSYCLFINEHINVYKCMNFYWTFFTILIEYVSRRKQIDFTIIFTHLKGPKKASFRILAKL